MMMTWGIRSRRVPEALLPVLLYPQLLLEPLLVVGVVLLRMRCLFRQRPTGTRTTEAPSIVTTTTHLRADKEGKPHGRTTPGKAPVLIRSMKNWGG